MRESGGRAPWDECAGGRHVGQEDCDVWWGVGGVAVSKVKALRLKVQPSAGFAVARGAQSRLIAPRVECDGAARTSQIEGGRIDSHEEERNVFQHTIVIYESFA